jgi:hypothetical protein
MVIPWGGYMVTSELAVVDGFDLARECGGMEQDSRECLAVFLGLPERSLVKVAELTGKSIGAIKMLSHRYRWAEIAARYDAHQANVLMGALRSSIVRHSCEAVNVGVTMMRDESSKPADRLKAAMWIASLGGLGPRSAPAVPDVENGVGAVNAEDLRKLATSGDPDDLRRLVKLTTGGRD